MWEQHQGPALGAGWESGHGYVPPQCDTQMLLCLLWGLCFDLRLPMSPAEGMHWSWDLPGL